MCQFTILNSIHHLIFPQFCGRCNGDLIDNNRLYCEKCIHDAISVTELGNWQQKLTHGTHIDKAYSLLWYDEMVHECVHELKYSGSIIPVSQLIDAVKLPSIDADILIPIPLYHSRQRERGYNQAEVLANILSEKLKLSVNSKILKRKQWTSSQTKLDNHERKLNMDNKFKCSSKPPKRILLIDDVLTTGATSDSCAQTLKDSGATWVGVITLATPRLLKV